MDIYEKVRKVPQEAQKPITGGRLKGKTDINPMWRIKTLTELFGACGTGWKYKIIDKQIISGITGIDRTEAIAVVDIELYYKQDGEWSDGIPATGGSMFIAMETGGLYISDECFKMALTDALSVACKALGVGADVYWEADATKYSNSTHSRIVHIDQSQAKKLVQLAQAKFGDNAALAFSELTGYKNTQEVPAAEYERVYTLLK